MKVIHAVGARPNFIRVAPILEEIKKYPSKFGPILIHSRQQSGYHMSRLLFDDPHLPELNEDKSKRECENLKNRGTGQVKREK